MKRLLLSLLSLCFIFAFIGCSFSNGKVSDSAASIESKETITLDISNVNDLYDAIDEISLNKTKEVKAYVKINDVVVDIDATEQMDSIVSLLDKLQFRQLSESEINSIIQNCTTAVDTAIPVGGVSNSVSFTFLGENNLNIGGFVAHSDTDKTYTYSADSNEYEITNFYEVKDEFSQVILPLFDRA